MANDLERRTRHFSFAFFLYQPICKQKDSSFLPWNKLGASQILSIPFISEKTIIFIKPGSKPTSSLTIQSNILMVTRAHSVFEKNIVDIFVFWIRKNPLSVSIIGLKDKTSKAGRSHNGESMLPLQVQFHTHTCMCFW